jgi:hypothetical protein
MDRLINQFVTLAILAVLSALPYAAFAQHSLTIIAGDGQSIRFPTSFINGIPVETNQKLQTNPAVSVTNNGKPVEGVNVVFTAPTYNGLRLAFGPTSAQSFKAVTDVNGVATLTDPVFATGTLEAMTSSRYYAVPINILAQIPNQSSSPASFIQSVNRFPLDGVNCPAIPPTVLDLSAQLLSADPLDFRIFPAVTVGQSGKPPPQQQPQTIDLTYIFINQILVEHSYLGNDVFRVTGSLPPQLANFSVLREWPDCTRRFNPVVRKSLAFSTIQSVPLRSMIGLSALVVLVGFFAWRQIAIR